MAKKKDHPARSVTNSKQMDRAEQEAQKLPKTEQEPSVPVRTIIPAMNARLSLQVPAQLICKTKSRYVPCAATCLQGTFSKR